MVKVERKDNKKAATVGKPRSIVGKGGKNLKLKG
jgi:hypothetical protein